MRTNNKNDWKQALQECRETWMKANYSACRDFGVPKKLYSDKTANSLTACVCDFLKFNNHYANRINTTGIMRKVNGQMKWTKGMTAKGTADIDSIIKGKPVKIEIKIGKDRLSEAQHKEKARIERAGGIYFVARNMDEFLKFYNSLMQ